MIRMQKENRNQICSAILSFYCSPEELPNLIELADLVKDHTLNVGFNNKNHLRRNLKPLFDHFEAETKRKIPNLSKKTKKCLMIQLNNLVCEFYVKDNQKNIITNMLHQLKAL